MLSLPRTITVEIATPAIEATPGGAVNAVPPGTARGSGFAATMLATQPVATDKVSHTTGAGEALPLTGNSLPQQTEIPIEAAAPKQGAVQSMAEPVAGSRAADTATPAWPELLLAAPSSDTAIALVETLSADAAITGTQQEAATGIATPAVPVEESADGVASAGLVDPQNLLSETVPTHAGAAHDALLPLDAPATTGTAPESDLLPTATLAGMTLTDQLHLSQRVNSKPLILVGAAAQTKIYASETIHFAFRQTTPVAQAVPQVEQQIGLGAAHGSSQGAAQHSTLPQADPASLQSLVGTHQVLRDEMAPILTSRLTGLPGILSSRQHGVPGGLAMSGNGLAATISPRPSNLPPTLAPLGKGLPEIRITSHGAAQIVDAERTTQQRILAPAAANTTASGTMTAVAAQPSAPMVPAIASDGLSPVAEPQNLTRAAQTAAEFATVAPRTANSSTASDSVQIVQSVPHPAGQNPASAAQAPLDTVAPVLPVAPTRYAKSLMDSGGKAPATTVPIATTAVATAAGPDVMAVDSAPVATKPEAASVVLPSAATLTTPLPAATTASTTAAQVLPLPVTDNAWGDAISERVAVLAGQKITSADIRLNPAELGPLRVEVKVDDGNAQVNFVAQHAVTREAIEQALPRLRELLAAEGLNLTGADVSEQGVARDRGEKSGQSHASDTVNDGERDESHEDTDAAVRVSRGDALVDTFA